MKNYKQIFIILVVGIFVLPQIAMAAWWNPFSWSIFHRSNTQTQVLENRVKELESKLASSTDPNSPTTVATSSDTSNKFKSFYAVLPVSSAMRKCASTQCEIIRYYADTANIHIVGQNETGDWYQIEMKGDSGNLLQGWMSKSVFSKPKASTATGSSGGTTAKPTVVNNQVQQAPTPTPTPTLPTKPTVYPTNINYNGENLTWCNGGYWKPCNPGKKLYCPASGADATCVADTTTSSQPDLSNAANIKAQSISLLNQILTDLRSLEANQTYEINRMNSMLTTLASANDYASSILIELTTLRRNRLTSGLASLRSYISAVEGIKRTTESSDVSAFINFNPNQAYAQDIKFVNDSKSAAQTDKSSYDDSVRTYISI